MNKPVGILFFILLSGCIAKKNGDEREASYSRDTQISLDLLFRKFEKYSHTQLKDSFLFCGDELIERYRQISDYKSSSALYMRLYDSLYNWNDISKGDEYLSRFIETFDKRINDSAYQDNLMTALYYLGDDEARAGKYFQSLKHFEHYLILSDKEKFQKPARIAFVNFNIADIYVRLGDNTKGIICYSKAAEIYSSLNDSEHKVSAIASLANCHNNASAFSQAINVLNSAGSLKGISRERIFFLGLVRTETLLHLDKTGEALKIIDSISSLISPNDNFRQFQFSKVSAEVYAKAGEIRKAIEKINVAYHNALLVYNSTSYREIGKLFNLKGSYYQQLHFKDSSIYYYQQALCSVSTADLGNIFSLPLKSDVYAENTILEALDAKAEWMTKYYENGKHLEYWQCAIDCYDLSFEVERKLLLNFSYDESKIRMMKESRQRSEKAIALCYSLYKETGNNQWIEKAFHFAERNKAFIVLESVKHNLAASHIVQNDTLFQKVQQLQMEYAYAEKSLLEAKISNDTSLVNQSEQNKKKTDEQLQLAKISLYQNNTSYRQWMEQEDSISISNATELLPDNKTLLIEYFTGDSSSYVFTLSKNIPPRFISVNHQYLSEIDSLLSYFRDKNNIINDPQGYQVQANKVYNSWLSPCIRGMKEKNIIIIPDDKLTIVPFDALIKNASTSTTLSSWSYIIKDYRIDYGYSAAALLKQKLRPDHYSGAVAFAPGFANNERSLQALPFTAAEADNVNKISQATVYKNNSASLTQFRKSAPVSGIIHIASHARADGVEAGCSIEFADSTFYLNELYAMQLNTNLVVLSACQTGIGKIEKGEGPMSLARGFYYAGAKNIITSLWGINDQSTAMLFKDFYNKAGSGNYGQALYQSKISYLSSKLTNDKYSPYYWAGFVYIGTDINNVNYTWLWLSGVAIIVLLSGVLLYWYRKKRIKLYA